jgi:hypothetical protein
MCCDYFRYGENMEQVYLVHEPAPLSHWSSRAVAVYRQRQDAINEILARIPDMDQETQQHLQETGSYSDDPNDGIPYYCCVDLYEYSNTIDDPYYLFVTKYEYGDYVQYTIRDTYEQAVQSIVDDAPQLYIVVDNVIDNENVVGEVSYGQVVQKLNENDMVRIGYGVFTITKLAIQ